MNTRGKIAVAGATGRVGRHVVDVLEEQGHEVVPISRSVGADVVTGERLAEALSGVESLIDASSGASPEQQGATDFFTAATRNVQELGSRASVRRIIVVSIIGTDRFTAGYGAAKQAHERAMLAGPMPATIVRAAQFHEFVAQLMAWGAQIRPRCKSRDSSRDRVVHPTRSWRGPGFFRRDSSRVVKTYCDGNGRRRSALCADKAGAREVRSRPLQGSFLRGFRLRQWMARPPSRPSSWPSQRARSQPERSDSEYSLDNGAGAR